MSIIDNIKNAFKEVESKVEHALDPVEEASTPTVSTTVNASLATSIVTDTATVVSGNTHPVIQATEE